MITYLDTLDRELLLAINAQHAPFLDQLMWLVSSRLSWLLIAVAFLLTLRGKGWRFALLTLVALALTVLIADQFSSGLIKHAVERLRPTHDPALQTMVRTVNGYTGGLYGFVSGHAANSFGVALLMGLIMRSKPALWVLMAWAVLQCYSRIYLGVHYPGDIIGGTVVGLLSAALVAWLWRLAIRRQCPERAFAPRDGVLIAQAVLATTIIIIAAATLICLCR